MNLNEVKIYREACFIVILFEKEALFKEKYLKVSRVIAWIRGKEAKDLLRTDDFKV